MLSSLKLRLVLLLIPLIALTTGAFVVLTYLASESSRDAAILKTATTTGAYANQFDDRLQSIAEIAEGAASAVATKVQSGTPTLAPRGRSR